MKKNLRIASCILIVFFASNACVSNSLSQTVTAPTTTLTSLPVFDSNNYDSFAAAVDAIGRQKAILEVSKEHIINGNVTVPATLRLQFKKGGLLNINPNITVSICCNLEAGPYQIFKGDGTVKFRRGFIQDFYPQWWGAKGDGRTEDTIAVQKAINTVAAAGGGNVHFPKGSYIINSIVLDSNISIVGEGWDSILMQKSGVKYGVSVNPGSGGSSNPLNNKHDITIRDIHLKGTVEKDGFAEHYHLLNLNAVTNIVIKNCKFAGWRGDGIYIGSSNTPSTERHNQKITISKCLFDGVNNDNRNAISIIDGTDIAIDGNTFMNCTRANMPGAVDIEPDRNTFAIIKNIKITSNFFKNVGGAGGIITMSIPLSQKDLSTPVKQILIDGNTINESYSGPLRADGIRLYQIQQADSTMPSIDITVSNNQVNHTRRAFRVIGVKGVKFVNNSFSDSTYSSLIASPDIGYKCQDIEFNNNIFRELSSTEGVGINVFEIYNLSFVNNLFDNIGHADGSWGIAIQFNRSDVDAIRIEKNIFQGSRTTLAINTNLAPLSNPDHIQILDNTYAIRK